MTMRRVRIASLTVAACVGLTGGCKPKEPPAPSAPPQVKAPDSDSAPPIDAAAPGEIPGPEPGEMPTQFVGISMTPPEGWQAFTTAAQGRSMVAPPVGIFILPRVEGDQQDAMVRLTHYPKMREVSLQQNLDRWYGQVRQPDGRQTKDVAKLETFEVKGVTITLVDIPGTIGSQPDQRMLAAVIEHPQGPHFLKVQGPEATVNKWKDSVREYLHSVQITP